LADDVTITSRDFLPNYSELLERRLLDVEEKLAISASPVGRLFSALSQLSLNTYP